jgi:hypothetical protein
VATLAVIEVAAASILERIPALAGTRRETIVSNFLQTHVRHESYLFLRTSPGYPVIHDPGFRYRSSDLRRIWSQMGADVIELLQ